MSAPAPSSAYFPAERTGPVTWTARFVAQAYIDRIGERHGFDRRRLGRMFAERTERRFDDDPNDAQSNKCRLKTEGVIHLEHNPVSKVTAPVMLHLSQLAAYEVGKFRGRIGAGGPGFHFPAKAAPPKRVVDLGVPTAGRLQRRLIFFGRPHWLLEPAFLAGGLRRCQYIWHELALDLVIDGDDQVNFAVSFHRWSAFPSHKLWVVSSRAPQGREVATIGQEVFQALWRSAPPPDGFSRRFVRSAT